jgi:hypothetical protein
VKPIPETEKTPVLRTDYSDDAAWETICASIREASPEARDVFGKWSALCATIGQNFGELQVHVDFIDEPQYAGLTVDQLLRLLPETSHQTFLFVVDQVTVQHSDHPILVVDLFTRPGRAFRAVPSQIYAIECNFFVANMDWEEFAERVDADGVFRRSPE